MRLAGRVQDDGRALGQHRGHHRVLGGGHAHLVEEDLGAPEAALEGEAQARAPPRPGRPAAEREQVGVDAAPADPVAAGGRERRPAGSREQAGRQQHRAAELRHHAPGRGRGSRAGSRRGAPCPRRRPRRARPGGGALRAARSRRGCAGTLSTTTSPAHEQAGREDGQGLVLVAGRRDRAPQGMAALHQESIAGHGRVSIADHHNRPDFLTG